MRPSYKKLLNDLAADKAKTILLVLAIAIGVFGVGTILGAFAVLGREMDRNYTGTYPAHATIMLDKGLDAAAIQKIKTLPGVVEAERRATITARVRTDEGWRRLLLFVIDDFNKMKTNTFTPATGAWPPPDGGMVVERGALDFMGTAVGGGIEVKLPGGKAVIVPVSGSVHDPGLAPARQEQTGYGYISPATLATLGTSTGMDQMRIITSYRTAAEIERTAGEAAHLLQGLGYMVHEIQVPPPARHPHQGQMNAVLALLAAFACLLLVLGAVLVANAISVMMARQVREIGIMKTLGATSGTIARMYFFMIALIAGAGTAIAIPPGMFATGAFVERIAHLLNFRVFSSAIPGWVFVVQTLAGLAIPLGIAAFSVLRGSRLTIREAITDYGVRQDVCAPGMTQKTFAGRSGLGRTLTLSFRNLFRNHTRLVIALALLAAGGAIFMGALNLAKAWDSALGMLNDQRHYDLEVRLTRFAETENLAEKARALPGIKAVEVWGYTSTSFVGQGMFAITRTYPDTGHGSFTLLGVPAGSKLISLPLLRGRWLAAYGENEVVLNQWAAERVPGVQPGDTVMLVHEGEKTIWRVAGIVENIGSAAEAYIGKEAFDRMAVANGNGNMLRVAFSEKNSASFSGTSPVLEELLEREGAPVVVSLPTHILRNAVAEHMAILVAVLLAMAALMGAVGAMGLTSTVSMNIMDRTREIGVMRAIGAGPKAIFAILLMEGLMTGLMSILFAVALSVPLSLGLGRLIGNMAFRIPLPLTISPAAIAGWITIVIAGSAMATALPAWKGVRIPVRDALNYE